MFTFFFWGSTKIRQGKTPGRRIKSCVQTGPALQLREYQFCKEGHVGCLKPTPADPWKVIHHRFVVVFLHVSLSGRGDVGFYLSTVAHTLKSEVCCCIFANRLSVCVSLLNAVASWDGNIWWLIFLIPQEVRQYIILCK